MRKPKPRPLVEQLRDAGQLATPPRVYENLCMEAAARLEESLAALKAVLDKFHPSLQTPAALKNFPALALAVKAIADIEKPR
jgi:hypothetical protein